MIELPLDDVAIRHNVSLQVSPIYNYNGGETYFFLIPNGKTKTEAFKHYPIYVTKDFSKTYEFDVGDRSTRFVRMVGDRLLVAQSDTITHTKMWLLGYDYTQKVLRALYYKLCYVHLALPWL